jgi:hypothetical protein
MTTGGVHTLAVVSKYMRIRYVNGASAQGHLRIQTTAHQYKSKELTSTASQNISDQNDVLLSRIVNDHTLDLAREIVSDKKSVHIFGRNPAVGTSPEDIWFDGGNYNFLTTAATLECLSQDLDDGITGAGARTIHIQGLDASLNEIEETVELLANTSSAATTQSFFRVNHAHVETCGTYHGSNFNNIPIRVSGGGVNVADIGGGTYGGASGTAGYGLGKTELGLYTVPAGKSAYITRIEVNVDAGSNKTADLSLYQVRNSSTVSGDMSPRTLLWDADAVSGEFTTVFLSYLKIEQKSDIWFRAVATATAAIDVNFDLFLIDN